MTTDLPALIAAGLPLAEVAATTGRSLHYVVGFSVGSTGSYSDVNELPRSSSGGTVIRSTDIADFALGKMEGQKEKRRRESEADTAVLVRDNGG